MKIIDHRCINEMFLIKLVIMVNVRQLSDHFRNKDSIPRCWPEWETLFNVSSMGEMQRSPQSLVNLQSTVKLVCISWTKLFLNMLQKLEYREAAAVVAEQKIRVHLSIYKGKMLQCSTDCYCCIEMSHLCIVTMMLRINTSLLHSWFVPVFNITFVKKVSLRVWSLVLMKTSKIDRQRSELLLTVRPFTQHIIVNTGFRVLTSKYFD